MAKSGESGHKIIRYPSDEQVNKWRDAVPSSLKAIGLGKLIFNFRYQIYELGLVRSAANAKAEDIVHDAEAHPHRYLEMRALFEEWENPFDPIENIIFERLRGDTILRDRVIKAAIKAHLQPLYGSKIFEYLYLFYNAPYAEEFLMEVLEQNEPRWIGEVALSSLREYCQKQPYIERVVRKAVQNVQKNAGPESYKMWEALCAFPDTPWIKSILIEVVKTAGDPNFLFRESNFRMVRNRSFVRELIQALAEINPQGTVNYLHSITSPPPGTTPLEWTRAEIVLIFGDHVDLTQEDPETSERKRKQREAIGDENIQFALTLASALLGQTKSYADC